jgi:hypothetical protein
MSWRLTLIPCLSLFTENEVVVLLHRQLCLSNILIKSLKGFPSSFFVSQSTFPVFGVNSICVVDWQRQQNLLIIRHESSLHHKYFPFIFTLNSCSYLLSLSLNNIHSSISFKCMRLISGMIFVNELDKMWSDVSLKFMWNHSNTHRQIWKTKILRCRYTFFHVAVISYHALWVT